VSALAAATRLRGELEALSDVLLSGDGTALVNMEERLALALDGLAKDDHIDGPDRIAVAGALLGARAALVRCRALGAAIGHVTEATQIARGQQATYDHAGLAASRGELRGFSIDARL
jgi:hypothetical protein